MTSLQEIENHLDIEIADKKLRIGRKAQNKNRYYRYDDFYIVALTQDKWMIVDNDRKNRKLLKNYTWYYNNGYAKTMVGRSMKSYHQLLLNYEAGLVADHINRCKFDNRIDNLRIVTHQENMRNQPKRINNSSGVNGICKMQRQGNYYWAARIYDNNGMQISKSFNIKKLGDEEAKQLAIAQRQAWEQEFNYLGE